MKMKNESSLNMNTLQAQALCHGFHSGSGSVRASAAGWVEPRRAARVNEWWSDDHYDHNEDMDQFDHSITLKHWASSKSDFASFNCDIQCLASQMVTRSIDAWCHWSWSPVITPLVWMSGRVTRVSSTQQTDHLETIHNLSDRPRYNN